MNSKKKEDNSVNTLLYEPLETETYSVLCCAFSDISTFEQLIPTRRKFVSITPQSVLDWSFSKSFELCKELKNNSDNSSLMSRVLKLYLISIRSELTEDAGDDISRVKSSKVKAEKVDKNEKEKAEKDKKKDEAIRPDSSQNDTSRRKNKLKEKNPKVVFIEDEPENVDHFILLYGFSRETLEGMAEFHVDISAVYGALDDVLETIPHINISLDSNDSKEMFDAIATELYLISRAKNLFHSLNVRLIQIPDYNNTNSGEVEAKEYYKISKRLPQEIKENVNVIVACLLEDVFTERNVEEEESLVSYFEGKARVFGESFVELESIDCDAKCDIAENLLKRDSTLSFVADSIGCNRQVSSCKKKLREIVGKLKAVDDDAFDQALFVDSLKSSLSEKYADLSYARWINACSMLEIFEECICSFAEFRISAEQPSFVVVEFGHFDRIVDDLSIAIPSRMTFSRYYDLLKKGLDHQQISDLAGTYAYDGFGRESQVKTETQVVLTEDCCIQRKACDCVFGKCKTKVNLAQFYCLKTNLCNLSYGFNDKHILQFAINIADGVTLSLSNLLNQPQLSYKHSSGLNVFVSNDKVVCFDSESGDKFIISKRGTVLKVQRDESTLMDIHGTVVKQLKNGSSETKTAIGIIDIDPATLVKKTITNDGIIKLESDLSVETVYADGIRIKSEANTININVCGLKVVVEESKFSFDHDGFQVLLEGSFMKLAKFGISSLAVENNAVKFSFSGSIETFELNMSTLALSNSKGTLINEEGKICVGNVLRDPTSRFIVICRDGSGYELFNRENAEMLGNQLKLQGFHCVDDHGVANYSKPLRDGPTNNAIRLSNTYLFCQVTIT